jgi:chromosomal replication initiator protein
MFQKEQRAGGDGRSRSRQVRQEGDHSRGRFAVPARKPSHSQVTASPRAGTAAVAEVQPEHAVCPTNVEAAVVQAVIQRIGPARFGLWFRGQARFRRDNGTIVVATRNLQVRDWLEHTFGLAVREAVKEVCGVHVPLQWTIDPAAVQDDEGGGGASTPVAVATQAEKPVMPVENLPSKAKPVPPSRTEVQSRLEEGTAIPLPQPMLCESHIRSHHDFQPANGELRASRNGRTPRMIQTAGERNGFEGDEWIRPGIRGNDAASSWTRAGSGEMNLFGEPVAVTASRRSGSRRSVDSGETVVRGPRRWKRLEDFVVGACNRVAHAAAMSVVESPDEAVTPLVFHGPVGVGKTHLLEGIYAGLKRNAQQRPCYVTAEEFTTRFVSATHQGRMAAFRRQFREVTALLFDDLHFLASRKATQIEFLHTLDSLVAEGRPVVVTLDCHPRLADELMPELVDRLLGGAVWGLLPPDAETRLAILRHKAAGASPPIPDLVLRTLANCLRGNVRELEGAVHSLRHYAKVTGRPVDLILAREALGELIRHAVRVVTLPEVDAAVCTVLRLSPGTLQSKSRAWAVTHPRMIAVYLCRKHTSATYGEIARHFGAKTHSTAVAAEKKVRQWLERDASLSVGSQVWNVRDLIERIERHLHH